MYNLSKCIYQHTSSLHSCLKMHRQLRAQRGILFQLFHRNNTGLIMNQPKSDENVTQSPSRIWPNQGDARIESVTPPVSTTIFDISKAELIKDFFKGQLHLELLEFPEWDSKEKVHDLCEMHSQIKKIVLYLNSPEVDDTGSLTKEQLDRLKEFHLFGLSIPKSYNGLGLNRAQWSHLCEAIALDSSLWATLIAHQTKAAKVIELYGTEDQKSDYLPLMATGEKIGAYCVSEYSSGSDVRSMATQATFDPSTNEYILNGVKCWVTNGSLSDILIVFAKTPDQLENGGDITAFLIDSSADGVEVGPKIDTCGVRGAYINNITLTNVKVPAKNILGSVGSGSQIMQHIEAYYNLDVSTLAVGQIRYCLSYISEHCLKRHQFGQPIGDSQMVRDKLAEMVKNMYAIESAAFYFAHIWDAQPTRDLHLELGILKVFSTECLWAAINTCIELSGCYGLIKHVPFERFLRDSRMLISSGEKLGKGNHILALQLKHSQDGSRKEEGLSPTYIIPNDILRLRLAQAGLEHVRPNIQTWAFKVQSSMHRAFKSQYNRLVRERRLGYYKDTVGAGLKVTEGQASTNIGDHLHPTFGEIADQLAVYTLRFQSIIEAFFIIYGEEVADQQVILGRSVNYATDLLLLSIMLGRASRSISIGVHSNPFEITVVDAFAESAFERMEKLVSYNIKRDEKNHRIASELLTQRFYPINHPSTRVW